MEKRQEEGRREGKGGHDACAQVLMTRLGKPTLAAILAAPPLCGLLSYHVNRPPPGACCGAGITGHRHPGGKGSRTELEGGVAVANDGSARGSDALAWSPF